VYLLEGWLEKLFCADPVALVMPVHIRAIRGEHLNPVGFQVIYCCQNVNHVTKKMEGVLGVLCAYLQNFCAVNNRERCPKRNEVIIKKLVRM